MRGSLALMATAAWLVGCGPTDREPIEDTQVLDAQGDLDATEPGSDGVAETAGADADAEGEPDATDDAMDDATHDVAEPVEVVEGVTLTTATVTDPSAATWVEAAGQVGVTLPPGAAPVGAQVVVEGDGFAAQDSRPWQPLVAYDVKILVDGKPVQPSVPLEVRFRIFDQQLRKELAAEDQLFVARQDSALPGWTQLPTRIETDGQGVRWLVAKTANLSSFGSFLLQWPYTKLAVPGWKFYFRSDQDASAFGKFGIMEVVVAYRDIVDAAAKAYAAVGFKDPREGTDGFGYICVYVVADQDGGALYSSLTGSLTLNSVVGNDNEARHEAQHEVFHMFQNGEQNVLKMWDRLWFTEAAADYAAARVAQPTNQLYKTFDTDFFKVPVTHTDGKHEYATAVFVEWAVQKLKPLGTAFFPLHKAAMAAGSAEQGFADYIQAFAACNMPGCNSFQDYLLSFAIWALMSPGSPQAGLKVDAWADTKVSFGAGDKELPVGLGAKPWDVTIAGIQIDWFDNAGTRDISLWYPDSAPAGCRMRAWGVPGGDLAQAKELVAWNPEGDGFAFYTFAATQGDWILWMATTGDTCDAGLKVLAVPFCRITPGSDGTECVDRDGKHFGGPYSCHPTGIWGQPNDCTSS